MTNDETIYTGFNDLDKLTGGLKKGELVLIAGCPAMKKNTFALNIAMNSAIRNKNRVAIFSLDHSKEQIIKLMLCNSAKIDTQCTVSGNMQSKEWIKLIDAMKKFANAGIYIDDEKEINPQYVKEKYNMLVKQAENINLIIIDCISFEKSLKITDWIILEKLKNLAKELNIPIIIQVRLPLTVDGRNNKCPKISEIRKYPPDKVLFVNRNDYYNESNSQKAERVKIIVTKNLKGKTGTVNLLFDKDECNFKNIEE